MRGEEMHQLCQRPLTEADQRAVVRHLQALGRGEVELPEGRDELNQAIDEAMHQARLFRVVCGTWDMSLEVRVYELLAARDAMYLRATRKYRS